ncbi:MAG TPA: glycosyltransferase [Caulobacteraceae bacterium]|nr:glycosyltransferase [Caulobacteraceae bacterium]
MSTDWPIALAAGLPLAIWIYMMLARGGFWLADQRDDRGQPPDPAAWPAVVAVVPARDEADVIARSIGSLLAQDYPGEFRVILVDDNSSDGTARIAEGLGNQGSLTILGGAPLAPGWTGKLWAMSQGVAAASAGDARPKYLLLTDADIAHAPDNLRRLVARAEARNLALTSLMARLSCANAAERLLIPAFVYFFAMVYPFAQVNDPKSRIAGAAGGVMLARADALAAAGGVAAIRTALIDDCTLGALMKGQGPIWLGLTDRAESIRPYGSVAEIGRMISRSAYAQLNYSPLVLIGALAGLFVTYLAAPLIAIFAPNPWRWAGVAAWLLMALSFQPTLRFYRRSPLWGLALPAIAALYTAFTLQSAIDVWRGRGGAWKGRAQALAGRP